MSARHNRSTGLALGMLIALLGGAPVVADDVEVFLGTPSDPGARPNILLILDTSGSMSTTLESKVPFDPATTYSGTCVADRIYWRTGPGGPPDCSSDQYFNLTAQTCDEAARAFLGSGFYTDRMAQWDGVTDKRWEALDPLVKNQPVECRADRGLHGSILAAVETWAADGTN